MIDPDNLPKEPEQLAKVLPAGVPISGQPAKECKRCPGCPNQGACDGDGAAK